MNGGFKVMVHEISSKISRADFSDIFLKYGDMLTFYIDERNVYEGKRSGYVVYRNKRECYRAISELNDQPPFYLRLKFSFLDEGEGNNLVKKNDAEHLPALDTRLGETWKKNVQLNDKPDFRLSNPPLSKVKLLTNCRKCGNLAVKSCGECGILYCSKSCQLKNWEDHKNECSFFKSFPSNDNQIQDVANTENILPKWMNLIKRIEEEEKSCASNLASVQTSEERELIEEIGVNKKQNENFFGMGLGRGKLFIDGAGYGRGTRNKLSVGRGIWNVSIGRKDSRMCKNQVDGRTTPTVSGNLGKTYVDAGNEVHLSSSIQEKVDNDKVVAGVAQKGVCSVYEDGTREIFSEYKTNVTKKIVPMLENLAAGRKNVDINAIKRICQEEERSSSILPECPKKLSQERVSEEVIKSCKQESIPKVAETSGNKFLVNKNSNSQLDRWDLHSDNPNTQIVNYDLCTQYKKLSFNKFTKVAVYTCVAPDEYWVHSDLEELRMIMSLMRDKVHPSEAHYKPSLGNYCSVLFEKNVYRSKVLFVEESRAKVLFIDFGILNFCEFRDMSELPSVAKNYYAQAIHVKLDPWTPEKYQNLQKDSNISLKAVQEVDGLTKVHVEGVLYAQIAPKVKLSLPSAQSDNLSQSGTSMNNITEIQWPPSVLNLLKEGYAVACIVLSVHMNADEQKDEIVLAISFDDMSDDLESILIDFPEECNKLPEDPNFNPAVGELIAAYYEAREMWVRSVVLATGRNRWLVACCDFGVILEVTEIKKLPTGKNYGEIPSLAAKSHVISSLLPQDDLFSDDRIKENSSLCMVVGKRKNDLFECKLGLNEGPAFCTISLGVWNPEVDKPLVSSISSIPELEYVHLTSGSSVKIVAYYISLVMFVHPYDIETKRQIEELHNCISAYAEKSEPVKGIPKVGKMYISLFSGDMKHYRVVIKRVKSPEKIFVTYIDFGNDEEVSLSSLYDITPELEKIPCFGVKIELRKDFEKPLTKEANTFLSHLILENTELTLNFPNQNLKSCELIMKSGYLVNDILKRLTDPQSPENKSYKQTS